MVPIPGVLPKRRSTEQFRQVRDLIPQLLGHIEECSRSPLARFQELGKTWKSWLEPIACRWRFSKSNGIKEGLHNKMEMISRRAFGFRNFKNYRLIALCGWKALHELKVLTACA
jgi:transposase